MLASVTTGKDKYFTSPLSTRGEISVFRRGYIFVSSVQRDALEWNTNVSFSVSVEVFDENTEFSDDRLQAFSFLQPLLDDAVGTGSICQI